MTALLNILALRWRTIATVVAASFALLVVSLVTPEPVAPILAALGLLALLLLRLLAIRRGSPPRRNVRR